MRYLNVNLAKVDWLSTDVINYPTFNHRGSGGFVEFEVQFTVGGHSYTYSLQSNKTATAKSLRVCRDKAILIERRVTELWDKNAVLKFFSNAYYQAAKQHVALFTGLVLK